MKVVICKLPLVLAAIIALPAYGDAPQDENAETNVAFCNETPDENEAKKKAEELLARKYLKHKMLENRSDDVKRSWEMYSGSVKTIYKKKGKICHERKNKGDKVAELMRRVENASPNQTELFEETNRVLTEAEESYKKGSDEIEEFRKKVITDNDVERGEVISKELIKGAEEVVEVEKRELQGEVNVCWSKKQVNDKGNLYRMLKKLDAEARRLKGALADIQAQRARLMLKFGRNGNMGTLGSAPAAGSRAPLVAQSN